MAGPSTDRRRLLKRSAVLVAFGAIAGAESGARAAGTTAKADVKYQYTPHGSDHCSLCASFIRPPANDVGGPGSCKIVVGPIPQNGWCVLFSPAR